MRKPFFAYAKTKAQTSCMVTALLISAFVFAYLKVQFLYRLNPNVHASSCLPWLYSPVCIALDRRPKIQVLSQRGSIILQFQRRHFRFNQRPKQDYERINASQKCLIPNRYSMKMRFGPVHVLGAVARNTTDSPAWDVVNVYGSFEKSFISSLVNSICCLMYENEGNINNIHQKASHTKLLANKPNVRTFHMVCLNTQSSVGIVPVAVHLSQEGLGCDKNRDRYVKVEFPFLEPGFKIAIGTQIAYKNISAELIIEWMETYKFLQVDKVVSYYHRSINRDALNALTYYHHTGFVDLYELDLPLEDRYPRGFTHAGGQLFNDLRLTVFDSFERMSGYTYFGIIDFDEFLIPTRNRTLKEMLMDLQTAYKHAAGFVFKTQFFDTSSGRSNNDSHLILGQFVNRLAIDPIEDRPKQLFMPSRVRHGSISTHYFVPVKPFMRLELQ